MNDFRLELEIMFVKTAAGIKRFAISALSAGVHMWR